MKLDKKDRNKEYKRILTGLYVAEERHTTFYLCHALGHLSVTHKKMFEEYPELKILFPKNFDGCAITGDKLLFEEEDYAIREIILQFAIEMTE